MKMHFITLHSWWRTLLITGVRDRVLHSAYRYPASANERAFLLDKK